MRSDLAKLAAEQRGAFTRAQALQCYTPREVRTHTDDGRWRRIFRGVYCVADMPATPALRTVAARLALGCGVAACRDTAAQLHGFDVLGDATTHVLSERAWHSRASGLVVHNDSAQRDDIVARDGVWATNGARTAIDLAREYPRLDALPVLDLALRRGVPMNAMVAELAKQSGRRGIRQATELLGYATARAESPMESRTRLRCIDAGLPRPGVQVFVAIPLRTNRYLDLGWPELKIGLEYDSADWHSGVAAANRDTARHNWLTRDGWTMFYATSRMVYRTPEDFIQPIRELILAKPGAR